MPETRQLRAATQGLSLTYGRARILIRIGSVTCTVFRDPLSRVCLFFSS